MISRLRLRALFAGALVTAVLASPAVAEERIERFHAEIAVAADGNVTVTETIRVRAEGREIRRGIFRDIPTDYEDRLGNSIRIVPEIVDVRRNGATEPYRIERRSNGLRLYVGSAERFIEPGEHDYTIGYRVQRVLGFFDDHDELYWNVTGNDWGFPIDAAGATVSLPRGVPADAVGVEAYTGPQGASRRDYRAAVDLDGRARFETTGPLAPREGLTIVVSWPKGYVREPGLTEDIQFLLSQNLGLLIAFAAALAMFVYLFQAWRKAGVDPEAGVIFPHYEPPAGYSPASLRYVTEMGYDKRTFTAAVLNLAVKGFLRIDEDGGDYTLQRTEKPQDSTLAPGESALLRRLFASGPRVEMENSNHSIVSAAMKAHREALRHDYRQRYFVTNRRLLLPAVVLLAGAMIATAILRGFSLSVALVFVASFIGLLIFAWLLKAPTRRGRDLMDKAAGFRLYLEVAEKDDLDLRNPPERTPQLFEAYLPYALALEVEQPWAEQFTDVFARLRETGRTGWHPAWYGGRWDASNPVQMAGAVGGSLSSAIAAASTPPGSSSGSGGGGSSGGGAGGGGGGGW